MESSSSNGRFRQNEQEAEQATQNEQSSEIEFESPEAMLRRDAEQVGVPETLPRRLSDSIAKEPPQPWWKKWFSR